MPRNGSGTYTRPQADYVPGTTILATSVNSDLNDMAQALTASLARDGQTTPTANIPLGGFRITGLGNGTSATDAATLGQVDGRAEIDLASASTTDIGAQQSDNVRITGTTTITSFGTAANGVTRQLRFAAALTLTHNATSLQLPGLANITTAAGDTATAVSLGSGNWIITSYTRAASLGINRGVRVATNTGQVQYDFTGIPVGVRRITLILSDVSTNGSSIVQIQIGSTTFTTSGYVANSHAIDGTSVGSTQLGSGHIIDPGGAAILSRSGFVELFARAPNEWFSKHKLFVFGGANPRLHLGVAASPVLSGALDRIRLTTVNGTDTFDAGNIDIAWEF
jgi:hypothetical protein